MKKYLLGLLAIPFSLIAFSSAETISYSCDEENTCEGSITYDRNLCVDWNYNANFSFSNLPTCNTDECWFSFEGLDIYFDNNGFIIANCGEFPEGEEYSNLQSIEPIDDVSLPHSGTITITSNNTGGGDDNTGGGDDNTGGGDDNTGGGDIGGGVISNGYLDLIPAIDGLRGTVYQIIPFVIYIGIGVLLAILGFYAIRWLVNRIGGKINSYFNSKRD